MINIVENTLRDGSYVVDFQFTSQNTYDITKGLRDLGFKMIEVGHGLGLGAWNNPKAGLSKQTDEEYIRAAREAAKNAAIGVFFIITHLFSGLRVVMLAHNASRSTANAIWWGGAVVGVSISLLIMLGITGVRIG